MGSSLEEATKVMKANGFVPDPTENVTTKHFVGYMFEGKVSNNKCLALIAFNKKDELVKVRLGLIPKYESNVFELFATVMQSLNDKYGESSQSTLRFDSPYEYGDGYEVQAIKMGKCVAVALWVIDKVAIGIVLEREVYVSLTYEGPGWDLILKENKEDTTSMF